MSTPVDLAVEAHVAYTAAARRKVEAVQKLTKEQWPAFVAAVQALREAGNDSV